MQLVHHIIAIDDFKEDRKEARDEAWRTITKKDFYDSVYFNTQCVPIIVGGSNSYIEKLVEDLTQYVPIIVGESNLYIENLLEDPVFMFKYKYDSCFIWIDVEQSILNRRVDTRVDEMVNAVMVNEVRQIFIPNADYSKRNLQSIGVPEMARYLREEKNIDGDDESKKMILQDSISSIEHRKEVGTAWRNLVLQPRLDIVIGFLKNDDHNISEIEPDSDFTVEDFCMKSIVYKENSKMNTFINNNNKFNKKKVVFIMGAIGTENLGLDIVTNKITHAEKQGEIDKNSNFTAEDFCLKSIVYIEIF
ncbi:hypothetical protein H5410_001666 [Solanum commersonii]|uniref:Uncharacterized protein n=1 Tax=Solanum commersonii TaxID=4109 RepID=A0A9J6AZE9_SOLCO|nr:hypothetical protein H5410_001666 [Solanum commersonii]